MADEIRKVGIELTAQGAQEFTQSLKGIKAATSEAYSELKLAQSQYDKNTSAVDKLKDRQEYLQKVTEQYRKKSELLRGELEKAESAENRDENAIAKKRAELNQCNAKLNEYEKSLKDVNNQISTHSAQLEEWGGKLKTVGDKMTGVGKTLSTHVTAPLAAVGGVGVKKFAEVDKTMQLTNKTMGNTAEQADLLNRAMKDAAANSTFGMSDAATATLNFARAGLGAEEAASALAPAMNLAAGEGGSLDTVSAGLVATINGFHGSFDEASNYADVFAAACNNSALDVDSLSGAMSVAAPIFSSAGYSVNDAALYMGIMANNGIEADKAANSLKTGIARLVSPAKDGAEMMAKLGISVTNADGTMKDSTQVQQELHDAFGKLSESEQIAAASAIFGKNQMAPWLALINTAPEDVQSLNDDLSGAGMTIESFSQNLADNGKSVDDLKTKLEELGVSSDEFDSAIKNSHGDASIFASKLSEAADEGTSMTDVIGALGGSLEDVQGAMDGAKGTTEEMADAMMSGFGGSLEKLNSSIDVAVTSLGEALAPTIQEVADFIQGLVDKFNSLDPTQQQMIATIGLVVAAIGPLLVAIGTVISTIGTIVGAIGGVMGAIGALVGGAGIAGIIAAIGPLIATLAPFLIGGAVIAGIALAVDYIIKHWDELKQKASDMVNNIKQKFEDFKQGVVEKFNSLKDGARQKFEDMKQSVSDIAENIRSGVSKKFQAVYDKAHEIFKNVKDAITDPVESAKEFVGNLVEDIKGFFDFDWHLPDLKLPHIVVGSYIDVPVLGTIPDPSTLRVEWYRKAYETPYLFTEPTVMRGFGDGNGGEMVYGHANLMNDIKEAVRAAGSSGTFAPVINVYTQEGQSNEAIARYVMDKLTRQYERAARYV